MVIFQILNKLSSERHCKKKRSKNGPKFDMYHRIYTKINTEKIK